MASRTGRSAGGFFYRNVAMAGAGIPVVLGGFKGYNQLCAWREEEVDRFRSKAETLAVRGYVVVKASSKEKKERAWKRYLPWLERSWQRAQRFDLSQVATWPVVPNGRAHAFTEISNDGAQHYNIKIWGDHYEAQGVLAAFLDPDLEGAVTFGFWKTHWKLKLLTFLRFPKNRRPKTEIVGEPNGWGIVIFPTPGRSAGETTPKHAHVDGGRDGMLDQHGVGCFDDTHEEIYRMAALQLAFALYCCTPGDLTAARGSTGTYDQSHLLVLEALKRRCNSETTTWPSLKNAIQQEDLRGLLRQPTLQEDEMLLVAGPAIHGTMFATEPMPGPFPRVIMNPKCFVKNDDDDLFSIRAAIALKNTLDFQQGEQHAPPLRTCLEDPKSLWLKGGGDPDDFEKRVNRLVDRLEDHQS